MIRYKTSMASTYYNNNSEIKGGDGMQTLVLMNPGYVYYSDTQQSAQPQSGNFVFLDSNHTGNNPVNSHRHHTGMSHAPQPPPRYMYNPVEMVVPPCEATPSQQGLSLSLSSQQSILPSISPTAGDERRWAVGGGGGGGGSTSSASGVSNSVTGMHNMLLNSKYLKATQEILEEVVSVGGGAFKNSDQSTNGGSPSRITGEGVIRDETARKPACGAQLTTAERQEIQMKKAKLVSMLDEVEQRYKQYHHQMQIVISWFEQAAGIGSAKTYTSLALQTISKQFRCLKDAILGQIKAASMSLGQEDSRLIFVDNQLRHQRALQQLGMIQQNAWRPQRGLPEHSVSVLRAWLFEHFLHPYPKDSDKHMLAKQTDLTRSQVSNWFINARVRLWKPMVEEMYLEEIKKQEQKEENSSSRPEKSLSAVNSNREFKSTKQENSNSFNQVNQNIHPPTMSVSTGINFQNPSGYSLIGSLEMEGITQFSLKKPRTDLMAGIGGYPINEIERFSTEQFQFQQQYSGNGVSLTLGVPHCEKLTNQNIQLGRGELCEENEFSAINPSSSSHSAAMYGSMNIQTRKNFSAQTLRDFVA